MRDVREDLGAVAREMCDKVEKLLEHRKVGNDTASREVALASEVRGILKDIGEYIQKYQAQMLQTPSCFIRRALGEPEHE